MARAWLLMVIQLGSTQTGARAVGDVQQELWQFSQEAIAIWFRDVFNEHVLEDWVDWNYGDVEFAPRLVFIPPEKTQPQPLAGVTMDPATAAALDGAPPAKVAQLRAAYDRENRRYKAELARTLPLIFDDQELRQLGGVDALDEVEEQLHEAFLDMAVKPTRGRPARAATSSDGVRLPDRTLRRQPTPAEVLAQVDFAQIDADWETQAQQLVQSWQTIRATQITELAQLVEQAGGDLEQIAQIQATAVGGDTIASHLQTMASLGAGQAVAEASRQGHTSPTVPDLGELQDELSARAAALERMLAQALSQSAAQEAVRLTGGPLTPREVAAEVTTHLGGLTDAYLHDQFGGALSAALNGGRLAAMTANRRRPLYASELLDVNTCAPCAEVDGTNYPSAAAAAADYPAGGFRDCEGRLRCRGTVVAVYGEAPPTVNAAAVARDAARHVADSIRAELDAGARRPPRGGAGDQVAARARDRRVHPRPRHRHRDGDGTPRRAPRPRRRAAGGARPQRRGSHRRRAGARAAVADRRSRPRSDP
jgi:hypothetical protein